MGFVVTTPYNIGKRYDGKSYLAALRRFYGFDENTYDVMLSCSISTSMLIQHHTFIPWSSLPQNKNINLIFNL